MELGPQLLVDHIHGDQVGGGALDGLASGDEHDDDVVADLFWVVLVGIILDEHADNVIVALYSESTSDTLSSLLNDSFDELAKDLTVLEEELVC